ncbi:MULTISPECIES: 2-amino-3,7-dideoxy-D-threo-hept-6-ulosonate synthase [Actinomadura]|uniref:2-amino-3,7-dideoxy-D-threo-hept-6-ulosonate synthase n=1 Tax=Actinomadura yumaensis TaxID=111807 RepID=A0ABW2CJU4_9ACTN|nr:2-amino-3,7-dideoxy-D-threo-hept-6-ulosonate synthase [Actinomadura sp. J1-007]MWK38787.1 2-amino-4,5-dihydroxy-6-one-heptanoic acid-7-phosphate synthase [Actinomadura sp. J1-007]
MINQSFARGLRLERLYHHGARLLMVPLDHSVTEGPLAGGRDLDTLVGEISRNGADAIVLHKGALRYVRQDRFAHTSLIVHLSASTVHAPDPDAKYLVASVEEALRLGADVVSVHVNVGSSDERRQVTDLAKVADACDRWNVPLLAMMYPRGPGLDGPPDPALVAHVVTLATDLGADIVKTVYTGSPGTMAEVVRTATVPVLVAGGPRRDASAAMAFASEALSSGTAGIAMGRTVFQADDPAAMTRRLAGIVHAAPPRGAGPVPGPARGGHPSKEEA